MWLVQFVRMTDEILTSGSEVPSRFCRYMDSLNGCMDRNGGVHNVCVQAYNV